MRKWKRGGGSEREGNINDCASCTWWIEPATQVCALGLESNPGPFGAPVPRPKRQPLCTRARAFGRFPVKSASPAPAGLLRLLLPSPFSNRAQRADRVPTPVPTAVTAPLPPRVCKRYLSCFSWSVLLEGYPFYCSFQRNSFWCH